MKKIAIILDSIDFEKKYLLTNEIDNLILKICSHLIHEILKNDILAQVTILCLLEDSVRQISHLSGNINHHFQGIKRFFRKKTKKKDLFKDSLSFVRRLFFENKKAEICSIFFISNNPYQNNDFHNILAGVLKDDIIFNNISLNYNSFAMETLCKISKGTNFVSFANNFKIIISNIKKKFEGLISLKKGIHKIFFSETRFYYDFMKKNKKTILKNLKTACPICKTINEFLTGKFCYACGYDFKHTDFNNKNMLIDIKNTKIKTFYFYHYSIFYMKLELKNSKLNFIRKNKQKIDYMIKYKNIKCNSGENDVPRKLYYTSCNSNTKSIFK